MALSTDERALLTLIAESPAPVVMPGLLPELSPAEPGMSEDHPGHEAWLWRQIDWYHVSVHLRHRNLARVVAPSIGERGDTVEATDAGRAALAA